MRRIHQVFVLHGPVFESIDFLAERALTDQAIVGFNVMSVNNVIDFVGNTSKTVVASETFPLSRHCKR